MSWARYWGRQRGAALGAALLVLAITGAALAGEADVEAAEIRPSGRGGYDFKATVRHEDEGWHHYVDKWEVMTPEGKVLGTRVLTHPHITEQPFTRFLYDVEIPKEVGRVVMRAHDSMHGYGGKEVTLEVPR